MREELVGERYEAEQFRKADETAARLNESRKEAHDRHAKERGAEFKVGDNVMIRDVTTGKWSGEGMILEILPCRRLKIKFEGGLISEQSGGRRGRNVKKKRKKCDFDLTFFFTYT